MKILILAGFLGSGKTTLLLQIIEQVRAVSDKPTPIAVLENEIGSIGIDDQVLNGKGYTVTNMLSGCACCTLSGDLPRAVQDIQDDFDPDLLIIEATGLAIPQDMKANLVATLSATVRVCTLVDAFRWRRMITPMHTLLRQQLNSTDVICINKVDLVNQTELDYVLQTLDEFNTSALRLMLSANSPISQDQLSEIVGD